MIKIGTNRFKWAFRKIPREIQMLFADKMEQFINDWRHPSLRAKRIQGTDGVWEAGLNMSVRFTFEWIEENGKQICLLHNIGDHDHVLRPPY
ncbi:MAG: cytotoxin [Desulfitobacteriaceae bacterium]|nr:cytotoxin [Desulfitobacteriaceae bacterium]MDD4346912.1 cytotoxin [Desulfitobacteriaceae bacterium]MDD4401982.1 cytotoxin [Desulfitobacteriaceae bacterium]